MTQAEYATALAESNNAVRLWMAPEPEDPVPELAWKGRWGTHVAAFELYPQQTLSQILSFMDLPAL